MTAWYKLSVVFPSVSILSLMCFFACESIADAQDIFYYHHGEKVPLKIDSTKSYVLLKPDTQKNSLERSTKSTKAVLRRFDTVRPQTNLNLIADAPPPVLKWAIVDNIESTSLTLDRSEVANDIVYKAPFFLAPNGKPVGISHLLYVKLKREGDREALEKFAKEHKVEVLGNSKLMPNWFTLSCTKESSGNALEVANRLYETGKFEIAEPDFLADFNIKCANDAYFGQQWGLKNTGQGGGTNAIDIRICDAWSQSTGNRSVVVAVVDQGVELHHPDMPNMSSRSYDTATGGASRIRGNHGTACAGIIGAARNNNGNIGVVGVAPDTTLMSISDSLTLAPGAQQNLANGISWAWQNGAQVISNSWGHELLASALIDDAISQALTQGRGGKGCVVVFAAGNENGPVIYPANSNSEILVVGAMSPCGERKSFSSCDPESFWGSCYGATLDVVAPGVLIPTTDRLGADGYDSGDYTSKFNGTSSATPHVAGLAALILSVSSDLTQQEVVKIIESNARKVGSYSYQTVTGRPHGTWHEEMGYGLIDAAACLNASQSVGNGAGNLVRGALPGASEISVALQPASRKSAEKNAPTLAHAANNQGAWVEPQDTVASLTDTDRYAWRLFIALNWPADVAKREADPTRKFGENATSVWESWKLSSGRNDEVFLQNGQDPGPWLPGKPVVTRKLRDFETLPLQQVERRAHNRRVPLFDPIIADAGANENHMNKDAYEFFRKNELYNVEGQEALFNKAQAVFMKAASEERPIDFSEFRLDFPLNAKEVKAQWRPIGEEEKSRYRWEEFIDANGQKKIFGLTALHITTKDLPNWLWATFEHVDNPKRDGAEPWILPTRDRAAGANGFPEKMGIEGTRWENYRLRGTQIEFTNPVGESTLLANSQIEQSFQTSSSCITCHARAAIGPQVMRAANRLSIFAHEYGETVVGSVGVLDESLFVRKSSANPKTGELQYVPLDFVWSMRRAHRKSVNLAVGAVPSFEQDIKPLFRPRDVNAMRRFFDLSKYDDVKKHAKDILAELESGSMPCDGAWPDPDILRFRKWYEAGMPN